MSSIRNRIRQDIDDKFHGIGVSLRIAFFYTLYFSIVVLALFALAYLVISLTTERSEIAKVRDRLSEYQAWNRELGLEAVRDRFLEQGMNEPENLFLRISDGSGNATLVSTPRIGPILDESRIKDLPIDHTEPRMYLGFNPDHTWTVVSGELAPGIRIQVGKSNRSEEILLRRFRKIFLWSAFPTVLVGLLLGMIIGYQSIAPVRNLNDTITAIRRTGDLSQRVPLDSGSSELNEVGASFNELLSKQEHLVSAMRDSLSNVSHDLRTPLSRLRASLETGATEAPEDEERWGEGLEECDNVIGMLDTFLELGAAESGVLKLDSGPVDVGDLAENAADFYELVAEEKEVKIETIIANETPLVNGDHGRLLRMITNLVGNAVKFSPEKSVVSVRVGPVNDNVVIEVTDHGPGIPMDEQTKIWQRLYRGDSSRNAPGLGLGLSFVKAIAGAHGGSVEVISEVGKGSTFRVELPAHDT